MGCDMCGESKKLYVTLVEGVEMQLCDNCKIYGEVKRAIPTAKEREVHVKREQQWQAKKEIERNTVEVIVPGYGARIKNAREKLFDKVFDKDDKKQEKFAQQIGLKASQLHAFESEHREPSLETARKLERALGIKLVEQYVEEHKATDKTSSGPLTIADLLKK